MYDSYDSYDSDPSQSILSKLSTFDPMLMLMVGLLGILICITCACMACVCGAGIGYVFEQCTKDKFKKRRQRSKTKPEYLQVAVESEREQVFGVFITLVESMVFLICELFIFFEICKMSKCMKMTKNQIVIRKIEFW